MRFFFAFIGLVLVLIGEFTMEPSYVKQNDFRTKEYYPATVIDKYVRENCYEDGCTYDYTAFLELTNMDIKEVSLLEKDYNTHNLGDIINLERHVTDPVVISEKNRQGTVVFIGWMLIIIFGFAIMVMDD